MGSSQEELCKEGWHISDEGYNLLTENRTVKDKRTIIANALNTDIKDFGDSILSTEIKQNKTGKVILQIQKIRNIAAPKSKEESQAAPRMLKLTLTDGHTSCQAVEILNISSLSRTHTPPGSKLLIKSASIFSSCILLHPNCCSLLGGKVPALCEKWELAKNISEHVRSTAGPDGPPPWVNFGEKIVTSVSSEPFKSLASKTAKESTNEFDVHRQDAIATASTGAVKKVFGGGTKTAQESQLTNNRKYNNTRGNYENQNPQEGGNREYTRGFKGKREFKEKAVEKPQKPPEKISLFDFLEDKLPVNEVDIKTNSKSSDDNNLFKQEVQRTNTHWKDAPRNFSGPNSPRFQQQKFAGNTSKPKPRFNNFAPPARNNPDATNVSRSNENVVINNFVTNPVEAVSRNLGRMSLNSQFASRSLQQHLNLANDRNKFAKPQVTSSSGSWNWKIGDLCMAKYWEDGKYYNATVTNLTERTCVVQFNGYGNVEEVLKVDCIPISEPSQESHFNANTNNYNNKGSMGFRNSRRLYSNNRPFNKAT